MHFTLTLSLAALAIEAAVGYPPVLYRVIGHPVTWLGALIKLLEEALNQEKRSFATRRLLGVVALGILLASTALVSLAIERLVPANFAGAIILAVLASTLIAQRSLDQHVRAVADSLERSGLVQGRKAAAMIVGRNTEALDEAGVARAAIESLAENFSDGIVAPTFWIAVLGLPGGVLYKAANTADSMIGHKNERYAAFGWAAARFDDLINLPASRLAALWLILAACVVPGASARVAIKTVWRDAARHRSPNAGWPEAAMAGALGLQLAGPRVYGLDVVEDAFMGDGRRDLTSADIQRALWLYRTACVVQCSALFATILLVTARG